MAFTVTPWDVQGKVDYDRLIKEFGTRKIDDPLLGRMKKHVKQLHVMLRRGFFFSHRDLDLVLDDVDRGKGFFLYTGRGPSGAMHIGHLTPFLFNKWLQDVFKVNLYIEITDDEKFVQKADREWEQVRDQAAQDILDIAALGFDPDRTFIFRDAEYVKNVYPLMLKAARKITFSTAKAVFGFTNETNIGMIFYPSYQVIPTFFEQKRCLIPAAIDQDPYWRIQRDIAEGLGFHKTAAIHNKLLPPLQGMEGKMSSSRQESAIYLADSPETVRTKIMKYAFSGGAGNLKDHREKGGNPDVDVAFQWLHALFEEDDKKIRDLEAGYRSGQVTTGEMKDHLIGNLTGFLETHQKQKKHAAAAAKKMQYDGKLAKQMWETVF
ncbi:MAG: tryptophan--tRNA ligase [Candidatus Aenigmarchaeota archaeon]|nr:tryptophan--tRNA ligase [Candidatus Aenigmarchaeota archaeon]